MAQLLIRNLSADTVERLKVRAQARNRSLEAETRRILEQAAAVDAEDFWARADAFRHRLSADGGLGTDSAADIREGRDR
ncbi:MAG: hypothetical protein AAGI91_01005 [Bacteroidota bacterium]